MPGSPDAADPEAARPVGGGRDETGPLPGQVAVVIPRQRSSESPVGERVAAASTTPPAGDGDEPAITDLTASDRAGSSREPRPPRTPLALSVLGPVRLRHRRPRASPTAAPGGTVDTIDVDAPGEEVVTVAGLSRPGRELLAYLAVHPGGATRDAIIEALWPDSTADRPDTEPFPLGVSQRG